ncbi:MAG: EamA family transporter RarD [Acidobacteriota bacterium]|nr:EamA family transporter RarD [Acidobacteriota bacterium]
MATLGAFLIWGLSPLFWKLLLEVPAGQLLAHRVLWAALILACSLLWQRRLKETREIFTSARVFLTLTATTILISANWLIYIWAIVTERIVQASLGYYINPLVTVLLAMVFLSERLNRAQWIAVGLATVGVAAMVWGHGEVPWISLTLAMSFGLYGLLRKQVQAEAETGLFVETALLSPLVVIYLLRADRLGHGAFGHIGITTDTLLMASGVITALPLVLFTHGARRLPLTTVGFLQYVAPTLQFLLAIFVFREPFTRAHLVAFLFIWTALAVFSWDLRYRWRPPIP